MRELNFPKELTYENIEKQLYLNKGILLVPIEVKERLKDLIDNSRIYSRADIIDDLKEIYKILNK